MPEQTEKKLTGYPSIDKPWLKYYSEEAIHAPLPAYTIYEYLWENNREHLDEIALIFYERKITYRTLFANVEKTAKAFTAIGVKQGDVVTLCMLNQPETVYILYALNRIGAVACFVNVLSSEKELVDYLHEGDSKFFVALDLFFDKCAKAARTAGVEKLIIVPLFESLDLVKRIGYKVKVHPAMKEDFLISWSGFLRQGRGASFLPAHYAENRCAVIGHTGGTTGCPKGVMLSDKSFNGIVAQYRYKFHYSRQDLFLNLIVPFAIYGLIINIHLPLVLGISVILIPKVDPSETDKLFAEYKPNHIASIPGYWHSIVESKRIKDMSWLKTPAAGGAGMTVELERSLNAFFAEHGANTHFMNGYGMSEVGATACTQMADCAEPGSVGIPLPKTVIAAFDPDTLAEKPYGQEGEICISTPCVMLGYIGKEEETAKLIRRHPDGQLWVHTGDLGYIAESGSVYIKGRMKRVYITQQNGTVSKIFPDRIEQTIQKCAWVESCCAVCVENVENTFLPIVYLVRKPSCPCSDAEIIQKLEKRCKQELPEYAQPRAFHIWPSLPLTPVGKIDYRALERMAQSL